MKQADPTTSEGNTRGGGDAWILYKESTMSQHHCSHQFASRIIARLIDLNMSRVQLCSECRVPRSTLDRWLRSEVVIDESAANRICDRLNICD